ncbi:MAG: hypothetical protein H3Z50_02320 [archaeon]|nr:hypothetical protein [archaeon]MCP8305802.1 hypothetical protein [archaeon]
MSKTNPLDELEKLLEERSKERASLFKAFTAAIPSIRQSTIGWFKFEVDVLWKEMNLLEGVMPEEVLNGK